MQPADNNSVPVAGINNHNKINELEPEKRSPGVIDDWVYLGEEEQ